MVVIYGLYIDAFFLMNLVMDLLALYLTGVLLQYKAKLLRLLLAAGCGSAATVLLFMILRSYLLYQLVIHLLVNSGMLLIAYGRQRMRHFIKSWIFCYAFVFLAGGLMQWLNQTLFKGSRITLSMWITLCIGLTIALLYEKQWKLRRNLYPVILSVEGQEIRMKAYYDTGNLLMDPYRKEPVHIANRSIMEQYLLEKEQTGLRLIPYRSLGQQSGLLETVIIEQLCIKEGKEVVRIAPAVIGLAQEELFAKKDYQLILNCRALS